MWSGAALLQGRERRSITDLKSLFADYALHELGMKSSTVAQYVARLGYAEQATGKPLREIGPEDLRRLKRERPPGWGSSHLKGVLVAFRLFHDWGVLEGLWTRNDADLVKGPRVLDEDIPPLEAHKVRRLMAACRRPLEYRLVYLGAYAGMRIGEAASISGEMWGEGWLRFRGEKNDRIREIPVHPDLEAVKWKILAHPPTYDSTMQRVKRRLADRAGIHFVAHQLRKSFSNTLWDAGVPDRIVKALLGHSQDVTGRYIEVSRRMKLEAVKLLSYADDQGTST